MPAKSTIRRIIGNKSFTVRGVYNKVNGTLYNKSKWKAQKQLDKINKDCNLTAGGQADLRHHKGL